MGALADRLGKDLKDAMRAGDTVARDEIRGLLAAIQAERQSRLTVALQKRGLLLQGENVQLTPEQELQVGEVRRATEMTEADEMDVLQQRVKQHRQSIDFFERGGRQDLVQQEEAQLAVLGRYLPRQLGEAEIDAAVREAIAESGARGPRDMARVMPLLSQRLKGQADMKVVSGRVQALLQGA